MTNHKCNQGILVRFTFSFLECFLFGGLQVHSKTTREIFTTKKITQLLQFLKKLKRFNCALAKFMEVHAFVTALKFSKHLLLRS